MLKFSESRPLTLHPVTKEGKPIRNYRKAHLLDHFIRGRPVRCGEVITNIFEIPEGAKVALQQGSSRLIIKVQVQN